MVDYVKQIEPPQWMQDAAAQKIMSCLNAGHDDPMALFVGGCVRNSLLNKEIKDIDIATRHRPEEVTALLEQNGVQVIPTGIDHGTVTAVIDEKHFEITTLRHDVETDGRRATVSFTEDWGEDAARRDFTINTLLADENGNIFDPVGRGLDDLDNRRVVFVGEPEERIQEDYLRILRFFRFHAFYGAGVPDEQALAACGKFSDKLAELSKERVTDEFLKILSVDNPVEILKIIMNSNVLTAVFENQNWDENLNALSQLQKNNGLIDILPRLGLLCDDVNHLEDFFVMSRAQKSQLENIKKMNEQLETLNEQTIRKMVYRYGNSTAFQGLMSYAAKEGTDLDLSSFLSWEPPILPVNGEDIIEKGIETGPQVGEVLKQLEEWWLEHDMAPERTDCLEKLDAIISAIDGKGPAQAPFRL